MPKSQELIDILGISEDIFDELCTLNMCDEMTYKLKHLIHQSIVTIYSSKNRLQSTYKNYSTRVCIGVCKMTGYCYLFTNNGGYMLPTLRLPSFRDAMLLRRQLIEEESLIQKKHGLLQDLGWIHSQDLMQTIELNLQGVKETSKYPQKYRYVVAYIPKEKEFEELDGKTTVNNSTDNKVLNEYNQSHLMQFIKMGAVQLVASIPTSYKYSNTYSLNGVEYKAVEYYNKDSNIYAFKIGKDIIAISEYSLEELFS